jgi:plasmid replication initiation protein
VSSRRPLDPQLDFFIPFIAELPLRDQRETMERPFFSIAKRKRLQPIDYKSPDGSVWVKVQPHQDYGMATIWDADILIWAASILTEMKKRAMNDIPRTVQFHPYDLLKAINRPIGGEHYERLRATLDRLQSTVVRTNIRAREPQIPAVQLDRGLFRYHRRADRPQPRHESDHLGLAL